MKQNLQKYDKVPKSQVEEDFEEQERER